MRHKITALTPVHIGNGERLSNMEYAWSENRLWVIDIDMLVKKAGIPAESISYSMSKERFDMGFFLRQHNLKPSTVSRYSLSCREQPGVEIQSQLKDGLSRAYIPGSSIKGAIRTALLWNILKDDEALNTKASELLFETLSNPKAKKNQIDENIMKLAFGVDPNHDLLRALLVSDSSIIPADRLSVSGVKVLSLTEDSYYWKLNLSAEAIMEGPAGEFDLKVDRYLLKGEAAAELQFTNAHILDKIGPACMSFAEDYINREEEFFSECGLSEVESFYTKLKGLMKPEHRGKGFLVHLGWGSGWHGMTVARLFPDIVERIRDIYGMGRRDFEEFPKSRKLINSNGKLYPIGWIWVAN
jgi:CRISPR-associated protein Csm5